MGPARDCISLGLEQGDGDIRDEDSLLEKDDDHEDEDMDSLNDKERKPRDTHASRVDVPLGFSFSVRNLALIPFALLLASHILLARQCVVASTKQLLATEPIMRQWRVATMHTDLEILSKPNKGSRMGVVHPGDIVETYGNDEDSDYHLVVKPTAGFAGKTGRRGNERFEPLEYHHDSSICPIIYEGWWPEEARPRRYTYAPTPLVVAQQLWNAMQVFQLFLLLALGYEFSQENSEVSPEVQTRRKWAVRLLSLVAVCILPFSVYLISPGGHIFAFLALASQLLAILTPVSVLRVSIGEHDSDALGDSDSTPWTLSREETIACLCNLGSSLYNYAGSIKTWPHWKRHFYKIDAYFGWAASGDCSVDENFTMGLANVRVPLFVARSTGTTTGAQIFLLVWSVLPFLYVSYFLCMFVLAPRSPGKNVQRALCLYGMCHFLFFTDVVAYRYGRGMHSPHDALFHWFEKWAWRIAMLMPIYQNCTNGHWERGHRSVPILGKLLRWVLMFWFVFFFLFQVIQSDVFKFSQYLLGKHQEGLIDILGLSKAPFLRSVLYPYREALVTMIIMYGLLHLCCFTTFRIFVRREERDIPNRELVEEEDAELQMGLLKNSNGINADEEKGENNFS